MNMIQLLSKLTPEQARNHIVIKNTEMLSNDVFLSLNLGGYIVPLDVIEPGITSLKVNKAQVYTAIEELKGAINRGAFDNILKQMIKQFEALSKPVTSS